MSPGPPIGATPRGPAARRRGPPSPVQARETWVLADQPSPPVAQCLLLSALVSRIIQADLDLRALNKAWKSNKKTATWKKQASKK